MRLAAVQCRGHIVIPSGGGKRTSFYVKFLNIEFLDFFFK